MNYRNIIDNYGKQIQKSPLFAGMTGEETVKAMEILHAGYTEYGKGEVLHRPYTGMKKFGLVLYGGVCACMDDVEGNRMIMAEVTPGITFGESLCFMEIKDSPVYVYAAENAGVVWLSTEDLFCGDSDDFSVRLQKKFTAMLAQRTFVMNNRIQILSKLRLRDKLITYFTQLSEAAHSYTFEIPMNRDDLAVYIGTNRSALSRELARMKDDGIIDYYRNSVRILSDR